MRATANGRTAAATWHKHSFSNLLLSVRSKIFTPQIKNKDVNHLQRILGFAQEHNKEAVAPD
jgi:hypothetical protein